MTLIGHTSDNRAVSTSEPEASIISRPYQSPASKVMPLNCMAREGYVETTKENRDVDGRTVTVELSEETNTIMISSEYICEGESIYRLGSPFLGLKKHWDDHFGEDSRFEPSCKETIVRRHASECIVSSAD